MPQLRAVPRRVGGVEALRVGDELRAPAKSIILNAKFLVFDTKFLVFEYKIHDFYSPSSRRSKINTWPMSVS